MPTLASDLRKKLERVVSDAREVAEVGARAALEALAVHYYEPYPHMNPGQRELRNKLRARARQLGDRKLSRVDSQGKDHEIDRLVIECAYEHWHRMLFARFLAENGLLIEPGENMAISLAEAEELAKEEGVDVWFFSSRCAQKMLPQIFRPDDPLLQVSFAMEHRVKLESLLGSLPQPVFAASDSLGWVYQFWQSKKKEEINRSEVKIGADEISAVTQLFTEPYMVEFLLHNTLGAWWAGKMLASRDYEEANSESELRKKLALPEADWEYLRFVRGEDGQGGPWRPAAGTFEGWPKAAKEIKLLDPCCGSGHFLVAALHHLVPIRMNEEGLSAREAIDAVLCENLHGLEIDERCCQIAAFALAFAAWRYPSAGGYRLLPDLHIACTGIGPQSTEEQWVKLAEQSGMPSRTDERERIKNGLLKLHRLFSQAPILGSLINPKQLENDVFAADYQTIQPYLAAIREAEELDYDAHERAVAAQGMVKAVDLLVGGYTLVITNVPYLKRANQCEALKIFSTSFSPESQDELATIFLVRMLKSGSKGGTIALVTQQSLLFQNYYRKLRKQLLDRRCWRLVAPLGPGAFDTISGDVVQAILLVMDEQSSQPDHFLGFIQASSHRGSQMKLRQLLSQPVRQIVQSDYIARPDHRITVKKLVLSTPLSNYADCYQGICTGDYPRFGSFFWEIEFNKGDWILQMTTPRDGHPYSGYTNAILWEGGKGEFLRFLSERLGPDNLGSWLRGLDAWGRNGIAVSQMQDLGVGLYSGNAFDNNVAVLIPKKTDDLRPLWEFCRSGEFAAAVRNIDQSIKVSNKTFLKVGVDIDHWRVAAEESGSALPIPESDDPTQWLFHGRPEESTAPLHVAVARLLGYRWPAEYPHPDPLPGGEGTTSMRLSERARELTKRCEELLRYADRDGIVCIPSVRGEEPAAERLLRLLNACDIEPPKIRNFANGADLDDWLRNSFFGEHCKLFHDRPFVWHIWDGRKNDGFHALVNYHKLCESGGKGRKLLESLTYSYLGEWISRQKDGVKHGEGGAEDRLAAAMELQKRLEAILQGEPPFDVFVRWKPLHQQSIGWEPDINDGVRINIRPFLASDLPNGRTGAGILRCKPTIKWTKDRGKEPSRPKAEYPWFWGWDEKTEDFMGGETFDGNRWNDCHYTNKVKQAARATVGKGKP